MRREAMGCSAAHVRRPVQSLLQAAAHWHAPLQGRRAGPAFRAGCQDFAVGAPHDAWPRCGPLSWPSCITGPSRPRPCVA